MATVTERKRLTVLRAAWLLDGTSSTRTPDPAVVIDGRTIVAVGTVPDCDDPAAEVIDLPGATLLPGLVDSHVHLAFDASDDPVGHLAGRVDAAAFVAMTRAARLAARGGVTTVRDLGDRGYLSLAIRDAARTDRTLPTVVAAGPPITTPGGHCHFLGGAATGIDGPRGIRAAVRAHAERGVDVIKIMASGGGLTPGTHPDRPQFGLDELRAAVDEAHRHSLPITAHAHGTAAIAAAADAGVDGLEHATFMTADGVEPAPEAMVATLVERRIALGMTLPVPGVPLPPGAAERMPAVLDNGNRLYRAGARIIAASDAGIAPIVPPDAGRFAVGALTQLGMPVAEALRACTSRAAAACGLGDRKGRIAPGYDADILAVDGDPLADPAALHHFVQAGLIDIHAQEYSLTTAGRTTGCLLAGRGPDRSVR